MFKMVAIAVWVATGAKVADIVSPEDYASKIACESHIADQSRKVRKLMIDNYGEGRLVLKNVHCRLKKDGED